MSEPIITFPTAAAILTQAARDLGLAEDWRERVHMIGTEALPSCFPVTDLAVASIGAAGIALGDLLATAGFSPPRVIVDRHLASSWFRYSLLPLGWSLPDAWDPIAGDYRAADGWIKLHTNAPHHRTAALRLLGCAGEKEDVASAVGAWPAEALETAIIEAGGCAALMRSRSKWLAHGQGQALATEPLIALTRMGKAAQTSWHPDPAPKRTSSKRSSRHRGVSPGDCDRRLPSARSVCGGISLPMSLAPPWRNGSHELGDLDSLQDSAFVTVEDFDREGVPIAVSKGAAYDLFLTRTLRKATLVRSDTSASALDLFVSEGLAAAAGVRQPLQTYAAAHPGFRVIDGRFTVIEQAIAVPKGREAGRAWLYGFIEERKADGFVAASLDRSGQNEAGIAPRQADCP